MPSPPWWSVSRQTVKGKVTPPSFKLLCQVPGQNNKKSNQYTSLDTCRKKCGAEIWLRGDLECPHPGWSHCLISAPDFITVCPLLSMKIYVCMHSHPLVSALYILMVTFIFKHCIISKGLCTHTQTVCPCADAHICTRSSTFTYIIYAHVLVTSQTSSQGHMAWTYTQMHTCSCVLRHTHTLACPMYSHTCLAANSPPPTFVHPHSPAYTHIIQTSVCTQLLNQNPGLLMRLLSGTLEATLTLSYPTKSEWTVTVMGPREQRDHSGDRWGYLTYPVR